MEYEQLQSFFTESIDYLWDRKFRFLIVMAAVFFMLSGIISAYNSFDPAEITSSNALVASTTVEQVATTVSAETATTTVVVEPKPVSKTAAISNTIKEPVTTATSVPVKKVETPAKIQTISGRMPSRIVISKIGVDIAVANPTSTNDAVLNSILLSKVVHYAGSGTLDNGNMLIMGHSSELPVIHNPLYKVFTKLKTLQTGDEIKIYSGDTVQTYKVTTVRKVNTHATDAYVSFKSATPKLTLLTCNVLAEKSDRYLVEADLI